MSDTTDPTADPTAGQPAPLDLTRYGPWAVIAGGSEGVGSEFARLLAEAGINLVLVARRAAPLEVTAERCRALGVEVRTLVLDLTTTQSVEEVVAATADVEVGLLIYNAGANTHSEEFLSGDLAEFQKVIDLNVTTQMALSHHFGRLMRERGRGGIILVGSLAGYMGSVRHTVYGGVKAFSRIFAESLWIELRGHDVHVLELVLGVTRTPAMERVGLDFDVPGMLVAEPDEVALEGLTHLPDGPVWVAGGNGPGAEKRSTPDRTRAVLGAHKMMQRLMNLDH